MPSPVAPRASTGSGPHRSPFAAALAVALLLVVGCTSTDDGTRVRDVDGAGEPLDEASS